MSGGSSMPRWILRSTALSATFLKVVLLPSGRTLRRGEGGAVFKGGPSLGRAGLAPKGQFLDDQGQALLGPRLQGALVRIAGRHRRAGRLPLGLGRRGGRGGRGRGRHADPFLRRGDRVGAAAGGAGSSAGRCAA